MLMKYYIRKHRDSSIKGPFTAEDLICQLEAGIISSYWEAADGNGEAKEIVPQATSMWFPVSAIPELARLYQQRVSEPPVQQGKSPTNIVKVIGVVVIIATLILPVILLAHLHRQVENEFETFKYKHPHSLPNGIYMMGYDPINGNHFLFNISTGRRVTTNCIIRFNDGEIWKTEKGTWKTGYGTAVLLWGNPLKVIMRHTSLFLPFLPLFALGVLLFFKKNSHQQFIAKPPEGFAKKYVTFDHLKQDFLNGKITQEWMVRGEKETEYRPILDVLYSRK